MTEFSKRRPPEPMHSISQFVRLSFRLSVRLSVCVFTFEVPFKRFFAPTSQSWMSNILAKQRYGEIRIEINKYLVSKLTSI